MNNDKLYSVLSANQHYLATVLPILDDIDVRLDFLSLTSIAITVENTKNY